jgi:hypothetical protein
VETNLEDLVRDLIIAILGGLISSCCFTFMGLVFSMLVITISWPNRPSKTIPEVFLDKALKFLERGMKKETDKDNKYLEAYINKGMITLVPLIISAISYIMSSAIIGVIACIIFLISIFFDDGSGWWLIAKVVTTLVAGGTVILFLRGMNNVLRVDRLIKRLDQQGTPRASP